jgi:hypothetical protein
MKTRIITSLNQLKLMFEQQTEFMQLLQQKRTFPQFPLDLTKKDSQQYIKDYLTDAAGEVFEAIRELKNCKTHRATKIDDLNKGMFLEEICDALHYLLEVAILAGFTHDELFEAFIKKGRKNYRRIMRGY